MLKDTDFVHERELMKDINFFMMANVTSPQKYTFHSMYNVAGLKPAVEATTLQPIL
jgi:hypothetical protein